MRYAWGLDAYLAGSSYSFAARIAAHTVRPALRRWDRWAALKPDVITTNSATVQERIRRFWGRESEVIYGPTDVAANPLSMRDDGFLLVAARLLAYRRLDLAVMAANLLVPRPGDRGRWTGRGAAPRSRRPVSTLPAAPGSIGPDRPVDAVPCLPRALGGRHGTCPDRGDGRRQAGCSVPLGGITETVVEGATGVFFDEQTPEASAAAVLALDRLPINPVTIRDRATSIRHPPLPLSLRGDPRPARIGGRRRRRRLRTNPRCLGTRARHAPGRRAAREDAAPR